MSVLEKKKEKILKFKGAMAAVLTPFDKNGEVNVSVIPNYLKYLVGNRVDGIFICGTTGEGFNLTNEEKLTLIRAWRKAIDEQKADIMAVVLITSLCMKESVYLSKQVESLGFDAVAVLPPNYYRPTSIDDWVNYMKVFAESAPNTPLYYYHNAIRIGEFNFDIIEAIGEGLKQIPQLTALKFADYNVVRFSILQKRFKNVLKIMVGADDMLLTALAAIDCTAGNTSLFNLEEVVDSYKKMTEFLGKSDLESARKEMDKILEEKLKHLATGNFLLSLKTKIKSLGLDFGVPRPPVYYHYKW